MEQTPSFVEIPGGISVEAACPEQVEELVKIQQSCYSDAYVHPEHNITAEDIKAKNKQLEKPRYLEKTRMRITDANEIWLAAKSGDKIVGFVEAKKDNGNGEQRISRIFVRPEYQNKSAGRQLMNEVLSRLDKNKPVLLQVDKYNQRTIHFYGNFGFQTVGEGKPIGLPTGKEIPTVVMKLDRH
jgi:ribosomal protein S18 acetylase RimI-like enzyme